MCGLAGEVTFDGRGVAPEAIERMIACLEPRGPDGAGLHVQGSIGLGHRRLKIIDLSDQAAQPMADVELGLTIAFNGCIYNYPALRAELQAEGYRFISTGDTEVILKAWHAWGRSCVQRFKGMFAFAIHEHGSGRLALARDRFGIKPLYLARTAGRLRFASTLPALLAAGEVDTRIDPIALHHYMSWHAVVPAPRTILMGVRKLPPATVRIIEPDGSEQDHLYWRIDAERGAAELDRPAEDWCDLVQAALAEAVRRRMVADVPVGVLLSGGVDSSLIVALLAAAGQTGLETFSIGFEAAHGEAGDEFIYSDLVAQRFGTRHHKIFIPSSDLFDELPACVAAMSEPMVSYDNIGFYLLSREVAKHLKVVQSGQGADEIFAGYHWYPPLAESADPGHSYRAVFFDRDHARLNEELGPAWRLPEDPSAAFVEAHFAMPGAPTALDKALRLDSTVMLVDDPVKRVDNMTMAWGLEARVPFLDHDLAELAARIPPPVKLADGGKGVLKAVARRVLPAEIIDRPKGYFPVPALKYLDGPYLGLVGDALHGQAARERGLFSAPYIDRLLAEPRDHITPLGGSELWQAGLLELWLQTHGL